MSERTLCNLTPLSVQRTETACTVDVWGRTYRMGNGPLLTSMTTQGQEILAAPMRLVAVENGSDAVWEDPHCFIMRGADDDHADIRLTTQSKRFVVNTAIHAEFDGCLDCSVSIMPRGRTIQQDFGFVGVSDGSGYHLSRLWLEIPLKKEFAKFYLLHPINDEVYINGEKTTQRDVFAIADAVPNELSCPFKAQVYLGNDNSGFAMFFSSDEGWQPAEEKRTIECITEGDTVTLRIHLLDSEPLKWADPGPFDGIDLFPLEFRFGMQATPVKPMPQNLYQEKHVHIDCFKKILVNYEEFLFNPYEDTGEIVMDRLKRLGVNTLYIHEKWNDLQNSPELTETTAQRLRDIVREAHARGIKVVPYFGYELSSMSPMWHKREAFRRVSNDRFYEWHWYRFPYQRDLKVCYNSDWQDYFLTHLAELLDEFHFDGVYLDGTVTPWPCQNAAHGCGYTDANGVRHSTYPIWAVRKTMRRLYEIVTSRGGIVNCHTGGAYTVPALAFMSSIWDGETFQKPLLHREINEIPEDFIRAQFAGRNWGVPIQMLCYSNPPSWTFRQAMANTLLIGILPKPNDVGQPLEEMSRIWKTIDAFPITESVWRPYFTNETTTTHEKVKISYYESDRQMLAFVANIKNDPTGPVTITMDRAFSRVTDMEGAPVQTHGNSQIEVCFDQLDYRVLIFDKA